MSEQTSAPPLPSSTILLLRDGDSGLEVFMVKRHHQIDFASGALVFPGGKLDKGDSEASLKQHTTGAEHFDDAALAYRIGGIREAFEECGVLLARAAGSDELVDGTRAATLTEKHRDPLLKGALTMTDLALAEGLRFAADTLVPFAHWITPRGLPKRFDTHFFLAPVPPSQAALHDGSESVDSVWINPNKAVEEADAGRITLVFATRMNLLKLGRARSTAEAVAAAKGEPIVTVMPEMLKSPEGRMLRIPIEAGYGVSEVVVENIPRP